MLDQSHFQVRGKVVRATVEENGRLVARGHQISLTMDIDRGHAEDFMRLVAHSGTPFFTGAMSMKGQLEIPPGTDAVQDRIKLNGVFSLAKYVLPAPVFRIE